MEKNNFVEKSKNLAIAKFIYRYKSENNFAAPSKCNN